MITIKVLIALTAAIAAVNSLTVQDHWTQFKLKHGKNYKNIAEEKLRLDIFRKNLYKIAEHNAKYHEGLTSYTMGVNKFTDMTSQEFGSLLRKKNGPVPKIDRKRHVQKGTAPDSVDWREKNAVLAVKDQGDCGACYAFSAIGAIEGQNALKNDIRISLSEQQLIDCSDETAGCMGGDQVAALKYVLRHGLNSEEEYPYEGIDNECRAKKGSHVNVTDYMQVEATETALRDAVGTVGPIAVSLYAEPLQHYASGIFLEPSCLNGYQYLDHAGVAVGYGTDENGQKYWIVKNSWGADWGEKGFIRLARDADQCGIALDSSYPIL